MDSILMSVKKMLGVDPKYEYFDDDLIMHINSVFMILTQLGVGPKEGFAISSVNDTWTDFLGADKTKLAAVKSYMHAKVKLLFDPPSSSAQLDSLNRVASEFEWRLNVEVDPPQSESEVKIQNGVK